MAALSQKTVVGNIGNIYDKRTVGANNNSVIDFTVAVTRRQLKAGSRDEWEDAPTIWQRCTAWGRIADNIAESFKKGDSVILVGNEKVKSGYTNRDGKEIPESLFIEVSHIGLEISRHPATSKRPAANNNQSTQQAPAPRAEKPAAKKEPRPAQTTDDLDLDLDLDLDFDDVAPF